MTKIVSSSSIPLTADKIVDISEVNDETEPLLKPTKTTTTNSTTSNTTRTCIVKSTFSPKLIYFTLNMALYSSLTFTSAYFFDQWGLPIYQFGALSSLSIIELVGAVWWGDLADRTGKHGKILMWCTWMYCGLFCLLPVASWILPEEDAATLKLVISTVLLSGTYFCMSAFFPLVDSCVLKEMRNNNNSNSRSVEAESAGRNNNVNASFGQQRLWGTIGHAVISILSAQSISMFGWIGMFAVMILTCVAFSLIIYTIPAYDVSENETDCNENKNVEGDRFEKTASPTQSIILIPPFNESSTSDSTEHHEAESSTWKLIKRFDFSLLLLVITLCGYMRSILSIFLPYHLLIDLHQTPMFVGLTAVFRISAEILIFAFAQSSSRGGEEEDAQFRGNLSTKRRDVKLVLIGLFAGVVRVGGYGYLGRLKGWSGLPLWIVVFLLESLKGISVASLISGAVRLAHEMVPSRASTRAQALVSGTYSGLSTGLAGIVGGGVIYLLPDHNITTMFKFTAVMGIIGIIFSFKLYKILS